MKRGGLTLLMTGLAAVLYGAAPQASRVTAVERKLEDTPRLSVTASAGFEKPADELRVQIGVVNQSADAQEALDVNSDRMDKVVKAIRRAGLDKTDYQTGQFSIQPQYNVRPRNAGPEWERRIVGFQVTNTVAVKTSRLDLAGKLIQACNKAGANQINSISFGLADPRQYRAEAIRRATANARSDAGVLADAADLRLVRVISITFAPPQFFGGGGVGGGFMRAEAAAPPPSITPGDVTVRANVTINFEIAPK